MKYSCSCFQPLALTCYSLAPQSAQNIIPDRIGISPIGVSLLRPSRMRWTISNVAWSMIGSWVFSKIDHVLRLGGNADDARMVIAAAAESQNNDTKIYFAILKAAW